MKERIKGAFTKKKIFHFLKMALFVVALSLILLSLLGTVAHATGLVDDTINAENLYSKYPLSNYQLDFYVDNSWSWLPWNWLDGIGKSVQYGLYCITNFVWTISLYLSNATGYVVQEAYKLDFINDMADSIGQSIQTLAGVTENGFSSTGFYVGFLLLIILVVGMYVAYTGLIKRETSKALHAVINFVVVFVLSASFIAYAPDYIKKINDFSSDISYATRQKKKDIEEIMNNVRENDESLYYVSVTMIVMADDRDELESICETVDSIAKGAGCAVDTCMYKQREAVNTTLPIGVRQIETMRTMLTQSLAVLMPFNVQELCDRNGIYYGVNQISKNIIVGNRKKLLNGNGFIFGVSGAGKSFQAKMEMGSVLLSTDDNVIAVDPMNEYEDVTEKYNGTYINISTNTRNYINPMDMDVWNLDVLDSKGWVRDKCQFMLSICEQIMKEITPQQRSIISRCVKDLYMDIARSREKYVPTMEDLYNRLLEQEDKEARDVALGLEIFVTGALNIFNHQTNINVNNRFIVYGIRDLGESLAMLVMMETIQQKIIQNGEHGKATWFYIDEVHVLLNSPFSAEYLRQMWKKVRKQGGLCTGITQNIVDLLMSETSTTMLSNSAFILLLNQSSKDIEKIVEALEISEEQLNYVIDSPSGCGLIKCGSRMVPFDNVIDKDSELYRLYNTNLYEKMENRKKDE